MLGIGEERPNVDFQLQRVPMARIEGVVVNSTGQPTQNVQVMLNDATQSIPGVSGASRVRMRRAGSESPTSHQAATD